MIDAALRNADLRPRTLTQHRVLCIALTFACPPQRSTDGLRLYIQFKTHQFLIFPVAEHQRHKRHFEHPLLARYANVLHDFRQFSQRRATDLLIARYLGLCHLLKLRVFDADSIGGIGIMAS